MVCRSQSLENNVTGFFGFMLLILVKCRGRSVEESNREVSLAYGVFESAGGGFGGWVGMCLWMSGCLITRRADHLQIDHIDRDLSDV